MSEPAVVRVEPPRSKVPQRGQRFVDEDAMRRFGLWLRAARKAKGLTVKELADRIGVHDSYFGRVESGLRSIARRGDLLNRLAVVLDIDAREVWRQAQPTAPDLNPKETLASIESMAAALTTIKSERYRQVGQAILDVLKGGGKK